MSAFVRVLFLLSRNKTILILISSLLFILISGLLIIRGKKMKNSRKNRPISRDFRRKKSQNSRKNRLISRDFSRKNSFRRIFRGKFLEKLADFTGNFGGKLRQETNSKKQPISLNFLLANFAKIDSIFAST